MQRRSGGRSLGAVLFTDIVGSTAIAAEMGNTRWSELVSRHHRIVRQVIARFDGREVDTAGDGFFIAFERPADAIRCAVACTEAVRELGIEIRAGVAFGELETVGRKPSGLVVNTAARVMSVAGAGEVLLPAAVRDIVPGTGITFTEHGVHELKGLEGEFRLYSVAGVDGREIAPPLESDEAVERRREIFPGRQRRRWAWIASVAVGVIATVAGSILLLGDDPAAPPSRGAGPLQHVVASLDRETGRIGTTVDLGGPGPGIVGGSVFDHPLAAGEGGLWLLRAPVLYHVDPRHHEVRTPGVDVGIGASQVETGSGSVWVLSLHTVYRVHPGTDEATIGLELPPAGPTSYSLAVDDDIWVGVSDGTIVRLDPRAGGRERWDTGLSVDRIAVTDDAVWIADILAPAITALDRDTLQPLGEPIGISGSIDSIEAHDGDAWVLDRGTGIVTRIDGATLAVSRTARVGNDPTDMTSGLGAVWVADGEGSLYRVDASTLVVEEFPIGAEVRGVDVDEAGEELWVYLGAATDTG
jgi:class 3 adenylate cyclase